MKERSAIVRTGLNIMFLLGVLLFVFSLFYKNSGEAYIGSFRESLYFADGWTYSANGENAGSIALPARLHSEKGDTFVLRNVLPENITAGMNLSCSSYQQDIEIIIDGATRSRYRTGDFDIMVGYPPSAYVFADLFSEDAGKEIEIVITAYHSGTANISAPEFSYGHDVWLRLIGSNIPIVFEAAALILIGVIILAAFSVLHRKIDVGYSFFYLAQLIIVFSLWELSESKLRQLIFRSPYFSTVFSFVFVELIAAYVILFIDELQGHYYKRLYSVLEALIFAQLIINTVLNFTGIVYYYSTLIFFHIWTVAAIAAGVGTMILDMHSGRIKKYSTAAIGIAGVAVSAVLELVFFYLADRDILGFPIGIGLLVLVGATLVQTIEDILALKQQNDINEQAAQVAKEANKAKTDFLALISHEIRTPLNAVIGMNEMILRKSNEEYVTEYAENACTAGKTLLSIINNILDISKIEAGKMEIVEEEYELYSLVFDCYNLVSDSAEKKGLAFAYKVAENIPSKLYGDMFHIRQIAVNLLTNAIKYTDEGSVEISFSGKYTEKGYELCFSVKDTGIGLSEESKEKLFTSFQRFDMKRNQYVEGTGLGLAICKKMTELMDGTLDVESEYGKGSVFIVSIPQRAADKTPIGKIANLHYASDTKKEETEKFLASGARVLVVDDNEMNLKVFTSLLKGSGLDIDTAQSGRECLSKTEKQKYDIIFMDHMMPEMDGIETFSEMKLQQSGQNGSTPVIMLTANAIIGMKETYLEAGFSGYLSKPIDKGELTDTLRKFLPEEKIIHSDIAEKEGEKNEMDKIKELTAAFPDIDINKGLSYCSDSEEFYIELLNDLAAPAIREELQKAYDNNDMKLYAVKIHAVKGNARTLGLVHLGEIAEGLQFAAEKEEAEYIAAHHAEAAEELTKLEKCMEKL